MSDLSTSQFQMIARMAHDRWGLNLPEHKRSIVTSRLTSFVRKSSYASIAQYLRHLHRNADDEDLLVFFDVLSTNVTSFFRTPAHFDFLKKELYAPLQEDCVNSSKQPLRLWSAACSTGPEPYSLAINAAESLTNADQWDVKVLATDLSNSALKEARQAVYPADAVQGLDQPLLERHFLKGSNAKKSLVKVARQIRDMVTIRRMNLLDPWPFQGLFDVIMCRNVMIYFDTQTRFDLVMRFHNQLREGGYLFIGAAETLSGTQTPFHSVGANIYQK